MCPKHLCKRCLLPCKRKDAQPYGNIFVEHRKCFFLPWSNSLRQLLVQYVKANKWPSYMARMEILTVKWWKGLLHPECWQPYVKSWEGNDIKMDFSLFCPSFSFRAATAGMCFLGREPAVLFDYWFLPRALAETKAFLLQEIGGCQTSYFFY